MTSSSAFGAKHGFTLVELSVVLLIAALMVGFGLKALQGANPKNCYPETRTALQDIHGALENFARSKGRYPLPARIDYGSSNGEFGREASSGLASSGGVVFGSLPVNALGLGGDKAADCWNNKFTYAVTTALTTAPGYSSNGGAITLNTGTLSASSPLTTTAAFVVISHGQDGEGATPLTSAASVTARSCNVSGSKIDRENCDIAGGANTRFFDAAFNNGDGVSNFYDDVIIYAEKSALLVDCEVGSVVKWSSNQCGFQSETVMANGETLLNQWATSPPTNFHFTGAADIKCDAGTLTATNTTCDNNPCPTGCAYTDPRGGGSGCMTEGTARTYGDGICQRYACCGGAMQVTPLAHCPLTDGADEAVMCGM